MTHWPGPERRIDFAASDAETFNLIMDTRVAVEEHKKEMQQQFKEVKEELDAHANRVERLSESTLSMLQKQNLLIREVKEAFTKAFPEGDIEEHRRKHELWEQKEKEDREFWLKLKQNTINWMIIAALSWAGLILWSAFIQGPGGK